MKIIEAIESADTVHVVYFLLAAYVETLDYYDPLRSCLPDHVKSLPVADISDLAARLGTLRSLRDQHTRSRLRMPLEEALEVCGAAMRRLSEHARRSASNAAPGVLGHVVP